jgi:hypothetical protein
MLTLSNSFAKDARNRQTVRNAILKIMKFASYAAPLLKGYKIISVLAK